MFAAVKFAILCSDVIFFFNVTVLLTVSERNTLMILSMTAEADEVRVSLTGASNSS